MGRPRRMKCPGAMYHVYSRGNRRQVIFPDFSDYQAFERMLMMKVGTCHIKLFAWCLMPNHIHLLIETPEANLSQFMQQLLTSYARYMNQKYQLVGHVFQGRFRSSYCFRKKHLLRLICYIHLNPVQTKGKHLCDKPEDWRWSSHRHYLSSFERPAGVRSAIESIRARYFSPQPGEALRRYQRFIGLGQKCPRGKEVLDKEFLGDEEFIHEIKSGLDGSNTAIRPGLRSASSLLELAEWTALFFQIPLEALIGRKRGGNLGRIRQAFIHLARNEYRFPATQLAQFLNRDISAISQIIKRATLEKNPSGEMNSLRLSLTVTAKNPRVRLDV